MSAAYSLLLRIIHLLSHQHFCFFKPHTHTQTVYTKLLKKIRSFFVAHHLSTLCELVWNLSRLYERWSWFASGAFVCRSFYLILFFRRLIFFVLFCVNVYTLGPNWKTYNKVFNVTNGHTTTFIIRSSLYNLFLSNATIFWPKSNVLVFLLIASTVFFSLFFSLSPSFSSAHTLFCLERNYRWIIGWIIKTYLVSSVFFPSSSRFCFNVFWRWCEKLAVI